MHRPPLLLEAESTPGHMDLADATGKIPVTPGIDPGTFQLVAQCLNHYAIPGPLLPKHTIFISDDFCPEDEGSPFLTNTDT